MYKASFGAAALALLSFSVAPAFALPLPITDNFDGVSTELNTTPDGWTSVNGTVDTIAQDANNHFGLGGIPISCYGGSNGCIDLDGSTSNAGIFTTLGTFALEAGKTYQLSAEVSGNQRNAGPDSLLFGFTKSLSNPLSSAHVVASEQKDGIAADSPFTLYTLVFKATQNETVHAFFYNLLGGDNQGLILDSPSLQTVPLPAAAWLLLSGLIALGAVGRRRRTIEPMVAA